MVSADKGGAAALQAAPGAITVRRSRGLIPEITLSMPEPKGKASTTVRCEKKRMRSIARRDERPRTEPLRSTPRNLAAFSFSIRKKSSSTMVSPLVISPFSLRRFLFSFLFPRGGAPMIKPPEEEQQQRQREMATRLACIAFSMSSSCFPKLPLPHDAISTVGPLDRPIQGSQNSSTVGVLL